jgi:hypothetical protein
MSSGTLPWGYAASKSNGLLAFLHSNHTCSMIRPGTRMIMLTRLHPKLMHRPAPCAPGVLRIEIVLTISNGSHTVIWSSLALSPDNPTAVAFERAIGINRIRQGTALVNGLPCLLCCCSFARTREPRQILNTAQQKLQTQFLLGGTAHQTQIVGLWHP